MANFILILHFLWAVWMIAGVFIAGLVFLVPPFRKLRLFRRAHLVGILITATVPLWGGGICPLTRFEEYFDKSQYEDHGFLIHWMGEILYLDVDPVVISLVTAGAAVLTIISIIRHPPKK